MKLWTIVRISMSRSTRTLLYTHRATVTELVAVTETQTDRRAVGLLTSA